MAGDWIPYDVTLPTKPEVIYLARVTGRSRREVVGAMLEFWVWAQAHSVDGHVDGLASTDLSRIVADTDDAFWSAVASRHVQWIRDEVDGLRIANWDRWLGNGAKQRLLRNRRQSRWRGSGVDVDAPVDTHVDAHVDAPVDGARVTKASTTGQDRTVQEEKSILRNEKGTPHSRSTDGRPTGSDDHSDQSGATDDGQPALPGVTPPTSKRKRPAATDPPGFVAFWLAYPKKVGKGDARRWWVKHQPDPAFCDRILAAVAEASRSRQWQREDGRFVPNPLTWLNSERWDDSPEVTLPARKPEFVC